MEKKKEKNIQNCVQGTVLSTKTPSHSLSYDHYEVSLKLYLDSGNTSEFIEIQEWPSFLDWKYGKYPKLPHMRAGQQ
jgi:hypothetical protein